MSKKSFIRNSGPSDPGRSPKLGKEDPRFLAELGAQFRSPDAWVAWLTSAAIVAFGVIAVWAGWRFFHLEDEGLALRSGMICALSITVIGLMKMFLLQQMQADRLARAIARIEEILSARK